MRRSIYVVMALFGLAGAPHMAVAQSAETLADIRQELSVLYVEIQKLNRELSTTGSAGGTAGGATLLDRVNTIESELARLTAKTEELEFNIKSIVKDGTNRIGDLEFRLCELEADCDLGQLSEGTTLGNVDVSGAASSAASSTTSAAADPGVELAVGEKADFEAAEEALASGNFAEAASLLENYRNTYPGGPLADKAGIMRGDALEGAGDLTGAARAYLDVFSTTPDGPEAPSALFNLGRTLGRLGQTDEACLTLGEVEVRFPSADAVLEASSAMQNLGCQ